MPGHFIILVTVLAGTHTSYTTPVPFDGTAQQCINNAQHISSRSDRGFSAECVGNDEVGAKALDDFRYRDGAGNEPHARLDDAPTGPNPLDQP